MSISQLNKIIIYIVISLFLYSVCGCGFYNYYQYESYDKPILIKNWEIQDPLLISGTANEYGNSKTILNNYYYFKTKLYCFNTDKKYLTLHENNSFYNYPMSDSIKVKCGDSVYLLDSIIIVVDTVSLYSTKDSLIYSANISDTIYNSEDKHHSYIEDTSKKRFRLYFEGDAEDIRIRSAINYYHKSDNRQIMSLPVSFNMTKAKIKSFYVKGLEH